MDGGFVIMAFAMLLTAAAIRRDQAPVDPATRAERQRRFRALAVLIAAAGALVYAVLLAIMAVSLLYDLTLGHGPRSWLLFLIVPAAAAGSFALGVAGMVLIRDKGLPGRLARAWAAAVEAFFEPIPEGTKPKPARGELDLD